MRTPGSPNRTEKCSWPHTVLSADQERVLTEAIGRYRPHIQRVARTLARGDTALRDELDQQGCLQLWELGVEEIVSRTPEHVENTLTLRMMEERREALKEEAA